MTYNEAYTVVQVVLTTAINCILIYSVSRIRNIIKSKDYMDPNEKFAFAHMVNFLLDSIFKLVQISILFVAISKNAKWSDEMDDGDE